MRKLITNDYYKRLEMKKMGSAVTTQQQAKAVGETKNTKVEPNDHNGNVLSHHHEDLSPFTSLGQVLEKEFPNSMEMVDFVKNLHSKLESKGFVKHNTIACVATCRYVTTNDQYFYVA